jgi:hypothetical protein
MICLSFSIYWNEFHTNGRSDSDMFKFPSHGVPSHGLSLCFLLTIRWGIPRKISQIMSGFGHKNYPYPIETSMH